VLFLAVRTACHRGWTAGEDRSEIATLRAGRVRAAMLCFGVGERAEGAHGQRARTAGRDVAELPAFPALGAFRGGKHLFNSPVPGEEVDGGENGVSVGQGHCDSNGGGGFLFTGFRVWVKVPRRENGDSPGIADGLVKRGKELVIVRGEESKRDGVNQELCLLRSRFEDFQGELPIGKALFNLEVRGAK